MNFINTLTSAELVLATEAVPLIVGESGIGKTDLAKELARKKSWNLITIDANLLKEGEIGGLPTVKDNTTVYAVHHKLKELEKVAAQGETVLLFIDEINRCEHAVQQELMNLILNREINGFTLPPTVKILAAMNPSAKYGAEYDYQVVDMDAAQENRFVWLYMEPDYHQWLDWAAEVGLEAKVIEFIATFPENLHKINESDLRATPRSYERISSIYKIYQENAASISRSVFLNVIRGNVGRLIAEEFVSFVESNHEPLLTYEDIFAGAALSDTARQRIKAESHTRLYLAAKNILKHLETQINQDSNETAQLVSRLIDFLQACPADLMIGLMKDMKQNYEQTYAAALADDAFVESYFATYRSSR